MDREHTWEKQNLVTISDRTGMYDKMKCSVCGVTGKRYGLGQMGVKRDKKFSAGKYNGCKGELMSDPAPYEALDWQCPHGHRNAEARATMRMISVPSPAQASALDVFCRECPHMFTTIAVPIEPLDSPRACAVDFRIGTEGESGFEVRK